MTSHPAREKQAYPEPTVGALIVNEDGKVLLAKSQKWFGKLTLPGGHIEVGETMRDALRREVKEEVGLDVEVEQLLLVQEVMFTVEFWKRKHFIFFDFLCRTKRQQVKLDRDEIQDYVWAFPGEALNMDLDSFTRKTVEEYLAPRRQPTAT